jgi:metal-responsive CopG/Arc/MetJ family transcriptional regulator
VEWVRKVLSCKVSDYVYDVIDSRFENHSEVLRELIIRFINYLEEDKNDENKQRGTVEYSESGKDEVIDSDINLMNVIHNFIDNLKNIEDKK